MSVNLSEDATVLAMYEQSESKQEDKPRSYLGMSSLGASCDRKLWNDFRQVKAPRFAAKTLYAFADGHYSEDLTADRLRAVPGIELHTHMPDGNQYGFSDFGGHFKGHMDGKISGLEQAPNKWHVWEHKCSAQKTFNRFVKLTQENEKKDVLKMWNPTYYGQAQLYMSYGDFDRHYLTVCLAGSREYKAIRTHASKRDASNLKARAKDIIASDKPLDKISDKADYFECKWCSYKDLCHGIEKPAANCRTCVHSYPIMEGDSARWHCSKFNGLFTNEDYVSHCNAHLYIPSLLANFADVKQANPKEQTITYTSKLNGEDFTNGPYLNQYTSKEIYNTDTPLLGDVVLNDLKITFGGTMGVGNHG